MSAASRTASWAPSWINGPFAAPEIPDASPFADAQLRLRWEDIAQDGRIMLTALAPAIGWTVWGGLLRNHEGMVAAGKLGVISILSRLTASGTDEPLRVVEPVASRGTYELAHGADADGKVERLFMNAWVEMRGARGRMVPPEGPGPEVLAGRLFVEHTFTRMLAPPDQRKVVRFDVPGMPEVPAARYAQPAPRTAMELPPGATPIDDGYLPDPALTCFGLEHTDSNQHVNSLVYPRLFVEAALRRLDVLGRDRKVLVRHLDIAYRKPCFANDRVRVHLRLFELDGRVGAAGFLVADGEPLDRPRVYARILLA
ncbi:MAG: acyl-CoA thioesterase [Kofleriaceae bacterium]|nr:acyl-CoA thioesterase [Myxococcales bacterium]MCB9560189.1 acyl-CoA thioesterase [Kofleriaceae bacterium]MCB9571249.1 acyl-CoA thioesterase [Kofleriaceae bacterium]